MDIGSVNLEYFLGADNYMFPVYFFDGTYSLDYRNIHENGDLWGMIVAAKG